MSYKGKVYVITGPTASGKSALAIELAKRLDTEIISADSRQIYKGIPIVTAVPDTEEREGIPHHLMECLELDSYYNASQFENDALKITQDLLRQYGSAVVCGGSMLYIDSFCNGIDDLPTVPTEIRESLDKEWKGKGDDWLRSVLKNMDPDYWERVDLKNMKRIFHAVEIILTSGRPYSSLITGKKRERGFEIVKVCLDGPREDLFAGINRRVDVMIEKGLEEEAERVYPLRHLNSLNTVGLKEIFSYFDGDCDFETAREKIKRNTRVYAKKQLTWFKKDDQIKRLDFNLKPSENADIILKIS